MVEDPSPSPAMSSTYADRPDGGDRGDGSHHSSSSMVSPSTPYPYPPNTFSAGSPHLPSPSVPTQWPAADMNQSRGSCPPFPGSPPFSTGGNSIVGSPFQSSQIVQVPLISQTIRRNRIIEVPEVHVVEKITPKIQVQEVIRTVPKIEVQWVEKIVEVPQVQIVDKTVEVPEIQEITRSVPKVEIKEIIHQVPKYEYQVVEKYVDVPVIKNVEKIVEVPQIQQVIKHVEKVEVVEVPVETIKHVPRVEYKTVEKIRHVPGPIEYIDVPVYKIVEKDVIQTTEKIVEVPEIQDVCVETPVMVPSDSGEIVEIPVEVLVYVDVPEYQKVPGRVITVEREKVYEQIVEIPVPVPQEQVKIVKVPVQVPVDVVKEVPVPQYVDEVVQVPHYVPVLAPPPIIQPVPQEEIIEGDPVYETAPTRYIYDPPVYSDPIVVNSLEPIYQDASAPTMPSYPQSPPMMSVRRQSSGPACNSLSRCCTPKSRSQMPNFPQHQHPAHFPPQMMVRSPPMGRSMYYPPKQYPRPMMTRPTTAYPVSMTPPPLIKTSGGVPYSPQTGR